MRRAVSRRTSRNGVRAPKRVPRNRQKPNLLFLLSLFACSGLIAFVGSYIVRTPLLNVKSVSVSGLSLTNKESVDAATRYAVGKNILAVKTGVAQQNISRLEEVESVKVGRKFPSGLWVAIRERKPCAVVTNLAEYFMIQPDGYVFHKVEGPVAGLPLLVVDASEPISTGQITCSPLVRYGLRVVKSSSDEGLKTAKISVDRDANICLNMDSNLSVVLGQPDEIAEKMALLRDLLEARPSLPNEAEYLNLTCLKAPAIMPKTAQQQAAL